MLVQSRAMDAYRRFIDSNFAAEERTCTSKVPHETRAEARRWVR